jgi:hypothetical protein
MMKITITYEEADLLKFVAQMLAVKGLKPRQGIKITTTVVPSTDNAYPDGYDHAIIVDCEDGPLLDTCPLCNGRLSDGVAAPEPKQPAAVPVPLSPPYTQDEIEESDEQVAEQADVALDDSLGESFEPPILDVPPPSKGGDGGISSIVGASKRLQIQREKELPKSQQRMRGESGRPPKGGR